MIYLAVLFGFSLATSVSLVWIFQIINQNKDQKREIESLKHLARDIQRPSQTVWNDGFYQGYCRGWEDKKNYRMLISLQIDKTCSF